MKQYAISNNVITATNFIGRLNGFILKYANMLVTSFHEDICTDQALNIMHSFINTGIVTYGFIYNIVPSSKSTDEVKLDSTTFILLHEYKILLILLQDYVVH